MRAELRRGRSEVSETLQGGGRASREHGKQWWDEAESKAPFVTTMLRSPL